MNSPALRFVDHTYRDFSRYLEEGGQLIKHKKCEANFPSNVHKMLSDPAHSRVITWMPHGRSFKVLNKELLVSSVIPNYFVCKKYESFARQMNGWGFKRLYQSGPDLGSYYHECFLRGLPKLTRMIRRLPPNQGKATPYAAGEPNLYRISEEYPLSSTLLKRPAESGRATAGEFDDNSNVPSAQESNASLATRKNSSSSTTTSSTQEISLDSSGSVTNDGYRPHHSSHGSEVALHPTYQPGYGNQHAEQFHYTNHQYPSQGQPPQPISYPPQGMPPHFQYIPAPVPQQHYSEYVQPNIVPIEGHPPSVVDSHEPHASGDQTNPDTALTVPEWSSGAEGENKAQAPKN